MKLKRNLIPVLRKYPSSFFVILFVLGATSSALVVYLLKPEGKTESFNAFTNTFLIGVMFLTILVPLLAKYLYEDKRGKYSDQLSSIRDNLIWQNKIDEFIQNNLSIKHVQETLFHKIINNIEAYITSNLEEKISINEKSDLLNKRVLESLKPLEENIEKHIRTLERNSIVNLLIGIIATAIAITILATSTLSSIKFEGFQEFATHFFPRLTFVIFIQLFAFFFLRLYRTNFDDIRYFQNELTNISCKISSLKLAYYLKKDVDLSEIIKDISKVERNLKLSEGETTANIEKAKLDLKLDSQTFDVFSKLILAKQLFKSEEKV